MRQGQVVVTCMVSRVSGKQGDKEGGGGVGEKEPPLPIVASAPKAAVAVAWGWGTLMLCAQRCCPKPCPGVTGWPGSRAQPLFWGDHVVLAQRRGLEPSLPPTRSSRWTHWTFACVLGTGPWMGSQCRLSGLGTGPPRLPCLSPGGTQPFLRPSVPWAATLLLEPGQGSGLCPGEMGFWGAGPIAGVVKLAVWALGVGLRSRREVGQDWGMSWGFLGWEMQAGGDTGSLNPGLLGPEPGFLPRQAVPLTTIPA